jgi:hypothetical protein
LIFEKNHFRTKRLNEVVELMSLNPSDLDQKKSGHGKKNSPASAQVEMRGFEPPASTSLT